MSNTWMVKECDLVTESLSEEARAVIADLDYPVEWEIEEYEDKFTFYTESGTFPALNEPMKEQLIILWQHGVRGELTLYDMDAGGFDRWTLTDKGVEHQFAKPEFEEFVVAHVAITNSYWNFFVIRPVGEGESNEDVLKGVFLSRFCHPDVGFTPEEFEEQKGHFDVFPLVDDPDTIRRLEQVLEGDKRWRENLLKAFAKT